ncbi:MAG: carboxypeptidase regulatory-like domain-containing protein [Ignavibacteria bacterium]|jgi:hypothetical protein
MKILVGIVYSLFLMFFMLLCEEEESPTEAVSSLGKIKGAVTEFETENPITKVNVFTDPATSSVTTDNAGEYEIANVDSGTYKITAAKSGYDTLTISVTVSPNNTAVADFILQVYEDTSGDNFGNISGTVTNSETSQAVGQVNITTDPVTNSVNTNSSGQYSIENIKTGTYTVTAAKDGFVSASIQIAVEGGKTATADFLLAPEEEVNNFGTIIGTVKDIVTFTPLDQVNITTSPVTSSVTTDESGSFIIEGLSAGTFVLNAEKQGYDSTSISVSVAIGDTTTADIFMEETDTTTIPTTGEIAGVISDALSGNPLEDAIVTTDPATSLVTSGVEGKYSITNLTPGSYTVNVTKTGYGSNSGEVTVTAGETATADFTLLISTGSISGTVSYIDSTSTSIVIKDVLITTSPATSSILTGENGEFSIAEVSPGSYTINAEKTGFTTTTLSIVVTAGKNTNADIVMTKN